MTDKLTIWTVYQNPRDHPNRWVLRAHDVPGGARADCVVRKTYQALIQHIPTGCVRMTRWPGDDPMIVESWI